MQTQPKRILVLGTAGVAKCQIIRRFIETSYPSPDRALCVDFEKERLLPSGMGLYQWLDNSELDQRVLWAQGMGRFLATVSQQSQDIFLCVHGMIMRAHYGTRSPVNIPLLAGFRPDLVITLIDDVYSAWHRMDTLAKGQEYKGRPTLEQIVSGRRAEIFFGDLFAQYVRDSQNREVPHFVLAVHHPCVVLDRLIRSNPPPKCFYMSFPISEPRRKLSGGDPSAVREVNDFISKAYHFQLREPTIIFFCPLTIDEKPLTMAAQKSNRRKRAKMKWDGRSVNVVLFKRADRWKIPNVEGLTPLRDPNDFPEELRIPEEQVSEVIGSVDTDIRTRDFRLIDQSAGVLGFGPFFHRQPSRGVWAEILYATASLKPSHLYQPPKHVPIPRPGRRQGRSPFGHEPWTEFRLRHKTIPETLQALLSV